jgi:hypothetical protein
MKNYHVDTEHTPGPWVHYPEDNIIIGGADGRMILEWQARSVNVSVAERDSNARLIAAAPDLLAALQFVLTASGEQLTTAFEQAEDAITKATPV